MAVPVSGSGSRRNRDAQLLFYSEEDGGWIADLPDLDASGEVVGIEILHLRQRKNPIDPQKWDIEVDAA